MRYPEKPVDNAVNFPAVLSDGHVFAAQVFFQNWDKNDRLKWLVVIVKGVSELSDDVLGVGHKIQHLKPAMLLVEIKHKTWNRLALNPFFVQENKQFAINVDLV